MMVAASRVNIETLGKQTAGDTATLNSTTTLSSIKILQWNPHWECFSNHCGPKAQRALSAILAQSQVDFANIVEINERSDFYTPPWPWTIMTGRCSHPTIDSTSLIYDSNIWKTVGHAHPGCMHHHDRAFLLQVFKHKSSKEKVIVVGGHFPHGRMNDQMSAAVQKTLHFHPDVLGVILAADTNRGRGVSTRHVMSQAMGVRRGHVVASELFRTCCNNDGFHHHFDRVGATFGQSMHTEMLFDPQPWWTRKGEFHKAVLVTLQV